MIPHPDETVPAPAMDEAFERTRRTHGVLGLDLAASWGWAAIGVDGSYIASGHNTMRASHDRGAKMHHLALDIADLVTNYEPDFLVIETPIKRTNFHTARNLYAFAGCAAMVAHIREIGFLEFTRQEYTKAVLGKALTNSKVPGVVFARQFKPLLNSDDEADAIMLALAGHACRRGVAEAA